MSAVAPSAAADTLSVRVIPAIAEISAAAWDACANPDLTGSPQSISQQAQVLDEDKSELRGYRYNPFVSYSFLSSLERSLSVGAKAGWQPQHLLVENAKGELLGAAPCYLKSHSRGEYVFDHGWADA